MSMNGANKMPNATNKSPVSTTGSTSSADSAAAAHCDKSDLECVLFWKLNTKFEGTDLESYKLWE